ncbi:UNVERIFIED_CONTAM: hypothetical protein K2H54_042477 [Gekko kuhli]
MTGRISACLTEKHRNHTGEITPSSSAISSRLPTDLSPHHAECSQRRLGTGSVVADPFGLPQFKISCRRLLFAERISEVPISVFSKCGSSMYYDEDGDLAHEFYEETIVTKNGRKRAKLKRIHKNLIPQGIVKLEHPRIHVDFPVIICEA